MILVMNLLPVEAGDRTFTLDTPFLLAVGLLYQPEAAALAAMVGAMDLREVKGDVTVSRALFNRAQIGFCVLAAASTFHAISSELTPWGKAVLGTGVSVLVFHAANALIVAGYTRLRSGMPFAPALLGLTIGPAGSFLATYLGYGVLALVLAYLFEGVGIWAVLLFFIPLLAARQMLVRGEEAHSLAAELRNRERILERLFDRIAEERRDERLRIAAGLHDDVLQSLIRVGQLGSFLRQETSENPIAARDAADLVTVSSEASQSLRDVVNDLRKSPVGRGGLVPTLRSLAADLQLQWRVPVQVEATPGLQPAADLQLVVYQVAREVVVNSLKHSGANSVRVILKPHGDSGVILTVVDDGRGFDPSSALRGEHFGLRLVRERVALAGGSLEIETGTDGTTISALVPARPSEM
jgi:signal transduction histidine kinase